MEILLYNIKEICLSTSFCHGNNDTLDFDEKDPLAIEKFGEEKRNHHEHDENYEYTAGKEKSSPNQFSLEYMQWAADYYDERDEKTEKRKNSF